MSFSANCRNCSVIVDNGTGVFIQPNTEEYSYILTAKHNLYENYEEEKCSKPKSLDSIKLVAYDETIELSIINKYELYKCDIDIAILKIKKVDIFSPKIIPDEVNIGDKCILYGFPDNRKNKKCQREEQIRNFDLKVVDKLSYIIVENDKYYVKEDIIGCSGGGIFKDIEDEPCLIGIESRMDSVGKKENDVNNTRLRFFSIKYFNEIIKKHNDELLYLDDNKNSNIEESIIHLGNDESIIIKTVSIKVDGKTLNVSIYPVTFEEYDLFCIDTNKERPNKDYGEGKKPIVQIDWYEAKSYCEWLSKDNKTFCLLSSKDWEDIAQKNMFNISKDNWKEYILCNENSEYRIDEVNKRKCGALGIYDMYGNIHEWCSDGENENMRRAKGGSFQNTLDFILDTTNCSNFFKSDKEYELGFRVVYILDFLKELIDKVEKASYNLHETLLKVLIQDDDFKKFQYRKSIKLIKETIDEIHNLSSENIKNIVYDIKNIENERKKYNTSKYISRFNPTAVLQKDWYKHSNLLFGILKKIYQGNDKLLDKVIRSECHAKDMIEFTEELTDNKIEELIKGRKN